MVVNRFVCIVQNDRQYQVGIQEIFDRFLSEYPVLFSTSGEVFLIELAQMNPYPGLILFDQQLLQADGYQTLLTLKQHLAYTHLPVVIMSDDPATLDMDRLYELGVNSFIFKQADFSLFKTSLSNLCHYWLEFNQLPLSRYYP